jgi:hypothetical protein
MIPEAFTVWRIAWNPNLLITASRNGRSMMEKGVNSVEILKYRFPKSSSPSIPRKSRAVVMVQWLEVE